jgi:hypothetical protein
MPIFKNIFHNIGYTIHVNFHNLAMSRRAKMIEEGFDVGCINWDLYVKVLEAKYERQKNENTI